MVNWIDINIVYNFSVYIHEKCRHTLSVITLKILSFCTAPRSSIYGAKSHTYVKYDNHATVIRYLMGYNGNAITELYTGLPFIVRPLIASLHVKPPH